ncbi:MAG: S41 family peptidase [Candidatus Berkelbacteria bacterium]|nr:S41 family peptidase [Candidatus Berkelbacteria bacterium]
MKSAKFAKTVFVLSLAVVVLASGTIGYFLGNGRINLKADLSQRSGDLTDSDLKLFWEAYNKLKESYLGSIDPQKYLYGAIGGGYSSVGDPYTVFLPPELSEEFVKELSGDLEGIGIKIGMLDGMPAVIAPLDDSPAQKAGLKPKDKILKVDDTETAGVTLDEVVSKIRGKAGTRVKIVVMRDGEGETRSFEIERAKIDVKTVELGYKGDVAIITLNEFGFETKDEFLKAVQQVSDKNISKVILDLRNNPGGLLDGAVDISGEIFSRDTLVVIEEGKGEKRELKTSGNETLKQVKLAVLINGGTASSAEIVAGAVRDHGRGKVIGQKTFGKGTVQQYEGLTGGSAARITVAKWLTPKGINIDKNGIVPDIEVPEAQNALFSDNDPLINRAIEELSK